MGGSPDKAFFGRLIDLYADRHSSRYRVRTPFVKKWLLKHCHFGTDNYMFNPNALTLVLMIDGEPAAFMSGITCGEEMIVPRLSISEKFNFYSPGMLLVNECMKYLERETIIKTLDLAQVTEAYKYKMGGVEHIAYTFEIKPN